MKRFILSAAASLLLLSATAHQKVKVACVGNSVTYGMRVHDRERNCYPARLQAMLGDGFDVRNFGHSGATLLRRGHMPYVETDEYREAVEFAPDIAVIHLGLNDTDPRNWPNYSDEFTGDYLSLIDDFRRAAPACRIYICRMTPIFHTHRRFNEGTRDWYRQEQEAIENIARIAGLPLIDLQAPLYSRPDLLPDALHPDAEGAAILARTVYSALTGDFGGLQMAPVYSDNMVLQCDRPLRIAGTADAGEKVTVRIGRQRHTAEADPCSGRWEVVLEPLKASFKPLTLEVATPSRKLTFANVLAGEVWLCSGQSNMSFRVEESMPEEVEAQREYARTADFIRLFDMTPAGPNDKSEWSAEFLDSVNRLQYYRPAQWQLCTPESALRFSAVGFAFGRMLADSLKCPVGLIHNAIGGSPTEAWVPRRTLEAEFPEIMYNLASNTLIQEWVRWRAACNKGEKASAVQRHSFDPCYLFEAGVQPLDRYPLRGVIWYQGESNAHNLEAHERLFKMLVGSWRDYWGDSTMPFHFVQLSSIERPGWPRFRDSQRRLAAQTDHCEMAVCSDLGDRYDVHPRRKRAVGERLARLALKYDYGFGIVPSGPQPLAAEADGECAVLTFDNAEGLHSSDGEPLRTFEIAEFEGLYYPAEAVVEDGRIRLHSDSVHRPRFVRYGWQPYTEANLVNGEQLPATTFRTEVRY